MAEQIPPDHELVRTTPVYDNESIPAGLLRAHRVADGVWGRLVVSSGELGFVFEDDPDTVRSIAAGGSQVIPPGRLHHVELRGDVSFVVEFHRRR